MKPNISIYNINNSYSLSKKPLKKNETKNSLVFKGDINLTKTEQIDKNKALNNFIKGALSPLTSIFSSSKNILSTAVLLSFAGIVNTATAGRLAPVFVTMGALSSGVSIFNTAKSFLKAKNADEKEKCFYNAGASFSNVLLTITGSQAALKSAGIKTKKLNSIQALIKNIQQTPNSLKYSFNDIKNGLALKRIYNLVTFKKPLIIAIDGFKEKNILINDKMEYSHGNLVTKFIKILKKDARVLKFPSHKPDDTIRRLQQAEKLLKQGKKIDYINMSIGHMTDIEQLAKKTNLQLTADNLLTNRDAIVKSLRQNPDFTLQIKIIDLLERLSSIYKVDIRISAGNNGENCINTYTLAKGIKSVSSYTPDGKIFTAHANHSLVNERENGLFLMKKIHNKKGEFIGYNLTGGKKAEIPASELAEGISCYEKFIGKDINSILATDDMHVKAAKSIYVTKEGLKLDETIQNADKYNNFLFSPKKLLEYVKKYRPQERGIKNFLSMKKEFYHQLNSKILFSQENGKVLCKYKDYSVPSDISSVIMGTSFAAPASTGIAASKDFPDFISLADNTKITVPHVITSTENKKTTSENQY